MPSFTNTILALGALASLTSALKVTKPEQNTLWDSSKTNTISWDSVNTDPSSFDIYLAHMASHPPLYSLLYANVPKEKASVSVESLQLPTGNTYQINLVAHDKPEQIYAQSQQFNVTGEAVEATSTVEGYTGPTYAPTASAASKTVTGADGGDKTTLTKSTTTSTGTATKESAETTGTESGTASATETSATETESQSGSAANASSTPTTTPNAAVGNVAASGSLAALVLGVFALLA